MWIGVVNVIIVGVRFDFTLLGLGHMTSRGWWREQDFAPSTHGVGTDQQQFVVHPQYMPSFCCDDYVSKSSPLSPGRARELTQIVFVSGIETIIGTSIRLPHTFPDHA
jgi:hypothetical protein